MVNLSTLISYGINFDAVADANNKISSNTTGITGADQITNIYNDDEKSVLEAR